MNTQLKFMVISYGQMVFALTCELAPGHFQAKPKLTVAGLKQSLFFLKCPEEQAFSQPYLEKKLLELLKNPLLVHKYAEQMHTIIVENLTQAKDEGRTTWVEDGKPRTISQLNALLNANGYTSLNKNLPFSDAVLVSALGAQMNPLTLIAY